MNKRKMLQFKYRNWWNVRDGVGHQTAILPHFDVWWSYDYYIDGDVNPKDGATVVCIVFAWLGWCFECWINASENLI